MRRKTQQQRRFCPSRVRSGEEIVAARPPPRRPAQRRPRPSPGGCLKKHRWRMHTHVRMHTHAALPQFRSPNNQSPSARPVSLHFFLLACPSSALTCANLPSPRCAARHCARTSVRAAAVNDFDAALLERAVLLPLLLLLCAAGLRRGLRGQGLVVRLEGGPEAPLVLEQHVGVEEPSAGLGHRDNHLVLQAGLACARATTTEAQSSGKAEGSGPNPTQGRSSQRQANERRGRKKCEIRSGLF